MNLFNIDKNENNFKKHEVVILKNNIFIVIYDDYNLEVINNYKSFEKQRFLFTVNDKTSLSNIKSLFISLGFDNSFKILKINKYNSEVKIKNNKKQIFGTMINLSLIKNKIYFNKTGDSFFPLKKKISI